MNMIGTLPSSRSSAPISTHFSGFFPPSSLSFLSFSPATPFLQPFTHPLLDFPNNFLTAPPPSKPPISNPFSLCYHSHLSGLLVCVPPPTLAQKGGEKVITLEFEDSFKSWRLARPSIIWSHPFIDLLSQKLLIEHFLYFTRRAGELEAHQWIIEQ